MKANGRAKRVRVVAGGEPLVSSAGAALLVETAGATGLDRARSRALGPWRAARACHDPGKVVLDLAIAIALGGDCLADLAVVRAQPDLFGVVASDPTVSRPIEALAVDVEASVAALRSARADARAATWQHRPVLGTRPATPTPAPRLRTHRHHRTPSLATTTLRLATQPAHPPRTRTTTRTPLNTHPTPTRHPRTSGDTNAADRP